VAIFIDLTGKKFGHLYVIRRVKNDKSNRVQYLTRCEVDNCGNEKVVSGSRLTSKTQPMIHCGCLSSKHNSDAKKGNTNKPFRDLTDQTFGDLYVIRRVKNDKWGNAQFLTRCEVEGCGNEKVVRGDRLTAKTNPTTHCGCLSSKHRGDAKKTHGLSKTLEYDAEIQHKRRIKKQNNNLAFNLSYAESLKIARPKLDYCVYCGSTDNLTIDHIIPINKGGTQNPKNLIRACRSCNSAKNASFFIDWYIKTKRCKRSLTGIIADMNFDSIFHLQHYQDSMCPDYYEKNRSSVAAKILRAKVKNNKLLDRYYQSLNHYPTH